jgi:uncharacterized protein YegJ (DUF2314 family)
VDATLLNAPFAIAALEQGQRGRFPLAHLSDWAIYCEHGRFEPETIAELERCLDEA